MSIADLRENYEKGALLESDAAASPFDQFQHWFDEARAAAAPEANAMTLATASREGRPSARTVLLKGLDDHGFVFFTNYQSRKGLELTSNPFAALLFFWPSLERQIRIGAPSRPSAQPSRTRTTPVVRWAHDWAPGCPNRAPRLPTARRWYSVPPKSASNTAKTHPAPRTGVAIDWCRNGSSSGRDGHPACTTAWPTNSKRSSGAW